MKERLEEQLAMIERGRLYLYQQAVERLAKECGCSAQSIQQLPVEEQLKLYRNGHCLSYSSRYSCMLQRQVGIVGRILGLIPSLLSRCRIICIRPLCPYKKYNTKATLIEQNPPFEFYSPVP